MRSSLVIAALVAAAAPLSAQAPTLRQLQGAWRLVDAISYDSAGHAGAPLRAPGLVLITGRYISRNWTDTTGQAPTFARPWAPTDSEKAHRYGAFLGVAGRFTLSADTMIIRPVSARVPEYEGGYSRELVALRGDTLSLTMVAIVSSTGVPVHYYVAGGKQELRFVRAGSGL